MAKQSLRLGLKTEQRMALLGRLRMADWIEMPESEFARQVETLEKDVLFRKLFFGRAGQSGVVRRQRWPNSRFSAGFYELKEGLVSSGERADVEQSLEGKDALIAAIQKMGQEAFEKYFVYGEEALPLEEIAKRTGISFSQAQAAHDLLLEVGAKAQFEAPSRLAASSYRCLARFVLDGDKPVFEFFSAYWARGLYHVRYEELEKWKEGGFLDAGERRRLPHLLKRLETLNLRQSTIFRILESMSKLQAGFLAHQDEETRRPVSLRQLARRLDLSPSTVSRALSGRSVLMPWGKEMPLIALVPGRRSVLREIVAAWLNDGSQRTDAQIALKLKEERGISVSRRTVNAVRNEVLKNVR